MHFRILGSLDVVRNDQRIRISAPKQRAVLTALLLNANNEVPVDRIACYVWDGHPPVTAQTTIQSYIYRLRQLLRPVPGTELKTSTDSYLLSVDPADIDLWHFRNRASEAREKSQVGDARSAAAGLRQAIAIWRGNALAGIPGETIRQEARLLEGERITAYEDLFSSELALGNYRQIIPELQKAVSGYQFHEALRAKLMLAFYASGRQAEALQQYAIIRKRLREDLGIEPGLEIQDLHRAILAQASTTQLQALPLFERAI
jgi:DNA-binding SARP family transcriptional activator